jgi:hypothetical protein
MMFWWGTGRAAAGHGAHGTRSRRVQSQGAWRALLAHQGIASRPLPSEQLRAPELAFAGLVACSARPGVRQRHVDGQPRSWRGTGTGTADSRGCQRQRRLGLWFVLGPRRKPRRAGPCHCSGLALGVWGGGGVCFRRYKIPNPKAQSKSPRTNPVQNLGLF